MGIFNRKLLVLLIFINYFNNIYIFCDNGVEVEEIGDFGKAKDSDQPINSFINDYKNTQESDDESTQESDDESTQESDDESLIDGDKNEIIVQNPTESSPIIKKEQDQDKEEGEITNWIKKNKILFIFLSIATLIGGFFGIKSLVQKLFGKKNRAETDKTKGGDGTSNGLRNSIRYDDEEQRKQLQKAQQLSEIEANIERESQNLENHQHSQEEPQIQEEDEEEEQLSENQQNLYQNTGSMLQNLKNDQDSEEVELKRIQEVAGEAERIRIQVEEEAELRKQEDEEKIKNMNKTIDLFENRDVIVNVICNDHSRYSKELFEKYGYEYLEDTLDFTLPNIDFCKAIIDSNQDSIALLNTRLFITQDWTEFKEENLDDKDKDVLTFYLNIRNETEISTYFTIEKNKIYHNKQENMIILVEDNIIKGIINKEKNFFISTDKNKNIKLYFNNFFFQINSESKILVKYQILKHQYDSTIETECHAIILVLEDKNCHINISILNNNILDTNYNKSIVEAALKEYNKIATTIIKNIPDNF